MASYVGWSEGISGDWVGQTDLSPADWLIGPFEEAHRVWVERDPPEISSVGTIATYSFPSYVAVLHDDLEPSPRPGFDENLTDEVSLALADPLLAHTATNDTCWVAYWNGFGQMDEEWSLLPTVSLPSREDHLLEGPFSNLTDWKPGKRIWPLKDTSPDFWWPDDHAWLVASDTDLDATYIGCSKACAADLLALGIKGLIEVEADTPTIGH